MPQRVKIQPIECKTSPLTSTVKEDHLDDLFRRQLDEYHRVFDLEPGQFSPNGVLATRTAFLNDAGRVILFIDHNPVMLTSGGGLTLDAQVPWDSIDQVEGILLPRIKKCKVHENVKK